MKKKPATTEKNYGSNDVLHVAADLCKKLEELGSPFCVIGGVANQRWGEPRQTVDVDATVFLDFGDEQSITEQLLKLFPARVKDPIQFAIANRIVLLTSNEGTGIDISLGGLPYERRVIERSTIWSVKDHGDIRTCCAEDLVVLKAFASRSQDWLDIEKVVTRQNKKLNRELVHQELAPLAELKEEPEILQRLTQIFESASDF